MSGGGDIGGGGREGGVLERKGGRGGGGEIMWGAFPTCGPQLPFPRVLRDDVFGLFARTLPRSFPRCSGGRR